MLPLKAPAILLLLLAYVSTLQIAVLSNTQDMKSKDMQCYKCSDTDSCLYEDPPENETCTLSNDGCITMYVPKIQHVEKRCLCRIERDCLEQVGIVLSPGFCQMERSVDWAKYHVCLRKPSLQIRTEDPTDKEIEEYGERSEMSHVFCYCNANPFCNSNMTVPYINLRGTGNDLNANSLLLPILIFMLSLCF